MIEYERNARGHGVEWLIKTDKIRRQIAERNPGLMSDQGWAANKVDNITLARLAIEDEGACDTAIETWTASLADENIAARRGCAVNLAIACRLADRLEDSLSWCQTALQDTEDN